jgi:hypothetical protein
VLPKRVTVVVSERVIAAVPVAERELPVASLVPVPEQFVQEK